MKQDDPRYVGARRLRAMMAEQKLSQQRLAKESKVSQPEISRFLSDPDDPEWRPISEGAARKLGKYFDVPPTTFRLPAGSIDELLFGADPEDIEAIRRLAVIAAGKRR